MNEVIICLKIANLFDCTPRSLMYDDRIEMAELLVKAGYGKWVGDVFRLETKGLDCTFNELIQRRSTE